MITMKSEHTYIRNYNLKRKVISLSLTNPDTRFKKERIEKKLTNIISNYNNNPAPDIYKNRTSQFLTPLLKDKVQDHKMKQHYNMEVVRDKLFARNI